MQHWKCSTQDILWSGGCIIRCNVIMHNYDGIVLVSSCVTLEGSRSVDSYFWRLHHVVVGKRILACGNLEQQGEIYLHTHLLSKPLSYRKVDEHSKIELSWISTVQTLATLQCNPSHVYWEINPIEFNGASFQRSRIAIATSVWHLILHNIYICFPDFHLPLQFTSCHYLDTCWHLTQVNAARYSLENATENRNRACVN